MIDIAKVDRQVYSAVHGKKVILDDLKKHAYAMGWNHRSGHTSIDLYEEFTRDLWTVRFEWSEGGRIKGAGVYETKIDPDTGQPYSRSDDTRRGVHRTFHYGMVGSTRDKRGRLRKILGTSEENMKATLRELFELSIADDRAREAKRRAREDEWDVPGISREA